MAFQVLWLYVLDLSSPACGLFTDQCYEIALKKESSCVIS